jgi:hypothetical protein
MSSACMECNEHCQPTVASLESELEQAKEEIAELKATIEGRTIFCKRCVRLDPVAKQMAEALMWVGAASNEQQEQINEALAAYRQVTGANGDNRELEEKK